MISGGELLIRTLRKAGVETIFGLHGAHIDTVFQACLDHELPIIDTRHEAAAGHAAEGYARAGKRLGVALVTAGGGFTNALTPMANAWLDRTPVLFITGSGPLRDDETNTLQAGLDQVAMAKPVTKWAHRVVATDHIPRLVMQAVRTALAGPRGPVLLDIPWDVLMNQVEEDAVAIPELRLSNNGSRPSTTDVERTLDLLRAAERPVIVVGSEASRSASAKYLAALATTANIPVFADFEGFNLLSDLPPALRGGLIQNLYSFGRAEAAPDAVLMLGTRFGLNTVHGSGQLIPLDATVVQIDPDARELGRLQAIELGIAADVGGSIEELARCAADRGWPDRTDWCSKVTELVQKRYDSIAGKVEDGGALHPFTASQILAECVDQSVTVVADGALTYLWLSEVLSATRPAGFLTHGYLGSMGVGFGTAVGAQAADLVAGKRTILVTGDGSVGYSIGEFDTLVRHKLPLIVIIMNNRSWGATLHFQQLAVGPNRVTNTRLENGDYDAVAAAFGAAAYHVDDAAGFKAALGQAMTDNRPACINVRVALDPIPPEELILIGMDPFA
ncbi:thiamine pyrophosphate-binding protein [Altererythrobacter buctensis]|uniref:Thiamine pyrophosphate-binding protein n=2 Tax=Alteraurantiacibacter buctensis TaxID=1503981 RepID=A0A844Z5C0_9SPHN|nr:thiamine pyrophosphate-binding protein [Alteraurantiacibacter buctensis]